jgi:hypothetical protein
MTCAEFRPIASERRSMAQAHEHRPPPSAPGAGATRPALAPARRRGRLWAALALAGLLALGIGLGRLLGGGAAVAEGAAPAAPPAVVTVPAEAPESCLTALHRSDATIVLLVHGVRDRRLADAIKAYTKASKACREEVPGR